MSLSVQLKIRYPISSQGLPAVTDRRISKRRAASAGADPSSLMVDCLFVDSALTGMQRPLPSNTENSRPSCTTSQLSNTVLSCCPFRVTIGPTN